MNRPKHYAAKAKDPCPDGRYAFHLTANRILDGEPTPPFGTAPVEITDEMSAAEVRYWRRYAPVLELLERTAIMVAKGRLIGIGVPAASLDDPMSPTVQAVVDRMIHGERCMLQIDRENRGVGWITKPFIEPHVAIQVAARMRKGGDRAAAAHLNHGITRLSAMPGLSPDHIYRAHKRFCRPSSLARRRAYTGVILAGILNRFAVLDSIYEEARRQPDYQGLRGSVLAEAIHAHRDLHEVYHRAEARLDRRGLLMGPTDLAA